MVSWHRLSTLSGYQYVDLMYLPSLYCISLFYLYRSVGIFLLQGGYSRVLLGVVSETSTRLDRNVSLHFREGDCANILQHGI